MFQDLLKNPTVIVIVIVLVIAIAFYIFFIYTDVGKNFAKKYLPESIQKLLGIQGFILLGNRKLETVYRDAVNTLLKKIQGITLKYVIISEPELETMKSNIWNKLLKLYEDTKDEQKLVDVLGLSLVEYTQVELQAMGKDMPEDMLKEMNDVIIPDAQRYMTYKDNYYKFPILEFRNGQLVDKRNEVGETQDTPLNNLPINAGAPIITTQKIKTPNILVSNILTDEVNKDHGNLKAKQPFLGMNSNNLISGIRRTGFKTYNKGKEVWDPRGRPRAQLRYLSELNSTKDPNSLLRSGSNQVADLIETGKGFSNIEIYDPVYDQYMTRTGNDEYNTYRSVKDRFINPMETKQGMINKTLNGNILLDIKKEI